MVICHYLERCQSGLMYLLAKEAGRKPSRVRIPPSPQTTTQARSAEEIGLREREGGSKAGGGTQDERSKCLSPRRGREFLRRNLPKVGEEARNS